MSKERVPTISTPGSHIKEELDARGWQQVDLAYILGISGPHLNQILSGKKVITPDLARALGEAFDVPAEFFANLQNQYDLSRAKEPDPAVRKRAEFQSAIPIREMIRRGWIQDSDPTMLELQVIRFYEANNLNEVPKLRVAFAAKRTRYDDDPSEQVAWLFRVRQLARELKTPEFSADKLREAIQRMRPLMIEAEAVQEVPALLHDCGVRFVIVESLPGGKIDGVCTWLDDSSPVIGLSTLHDRLDNFWFVLRHECEHVLQGHGKEKGILDNLEGEAASYSDNIIEEERIANAAAADFCVPRDRMMSFYMRKKPFFSERDVVGFASVLEIHPALVVGQLQNLMKRYDYLRKYQIRIREYITAHAFTDGWNKVAPANL